MKIKNTSLKETRNRLKLTQAELAKLLGVSPNTLARWERGEMSPPGNLLSLALKTLIKQ